LYADIWDDIVLKHFKPWMDMDVAHYPVLGVHEGFTRAMDLAPGMIMHLLLESQLFFMPAGELLSAEVAIGDTYYPCMIFLLEVCNLLLGMCWLVDMGFTDIYLSIQGGAMGLMAMVECSKLKWV
jgi:hypothetical protein